MTWYGHCGSPSSLWKVPWPVATGRGASLWDGLGPGFVFYPGVDLLPSCPARLPGLSGPTSTPQLLPLLCPPHSMCGPIHFPYVMCVCPRLLRICHCLPQFLPPTIQGEPVGTDFTELEWLPGTPCWQASPLTVCTPATVPDFSQQPLPFVLLHTSVTQLTACCCLEMPSLHQTAWDAGTPLGSGAPVPPKTGNHD